MGSIRIEELYSKLEIEESAIAKFPAIASKLNLDYIKNLFFTDEDGFFEYLDTNLKEDYLSILYIYINIAVDLYDTYVEKGIDLSIYYDTIDDIRIWANNCLKETGVYGLKEIYWVNEHLRMRIFKLGRLQFQKRESSEFVEMMKEHGLGDKVKHNYFYFVHIPEGERLSHDLVKDSYERAVKFFNDDMIFAAESWILSDRLEMLFDSESNLIKFKNDYIVLSQERNVNPIKRYLRNGTKLYDKVTTLEKEGILIGEGFGVCLDYLK